MVANMLNGASDMRFKMNGNGLSLDGLALCKPYMNLMMKKGLHSTKDARKCKKGYREMFWNITI
jgi:hypothetical protein